MHVPVMYGIIERRILVNFRVDPAVLSARLPPPFRPKTINGYGLAGICLIRLGRIRPRFLPAALGLSSENAAHRIAVEWDTADGSAEGVFIPRRDTDSRLNAIAGGRIFPGRHHHAWFAVAEAAGRYEVEMTADDGETRVRVCGHEADGLPPTSCFASVVAASDFFRRGSVGWSPNGRGGFDGLELRTGSWNIRPLAVEHLESGWFENRWLFPPGSAEFDSAFVMRNVEHEWHVRGVMAAQRRPG